MDWPLILSALATILVGVLAYGFKRRDKELDGLRLKTQELEVQVAGLTATYDTAIQQIQTDIAEIKRWVMPPPRERMPSQVE